MIVVIVVDVAIDELVGNDVAVDIDDPAGVGDSVGVGGPAIVVVAVVIVVIIVFVSIDGGVGSLTVEPGAGVGWLVVAIGGVAPFGCGYKQKKKIITQISEYPKARASIPSAKELEEASVTVSPMEWAVWEAMVEVLVPALARDRWRSCRLD
jgi:hypothetical protein